MRMQQNVTVKNNDGRELLTLEGCDEAEIFTIAETLDGTIRFHNPSLQKKWENHHV